MMTMYFNRSSTADEFISHLRSTINEMVYKKFLDTYRNYQHNPFKVLK